MLVHKSGKKRVHPADLSHVARENKEKYKCEQQAVIHFPKKVPHEQRKHGQYHSRQKLVWCHTEYAQQAQHEQYAQRGQAARVVSVHISHGDGDGPGRHEQHAHAQQRKAGRRKGQHGAEKIGGGQGKTIVEKKILRIANRRGHAKEGAVRPVTLDKYKMTLSWVKRLAPDLKLCEVSRVTYQQLLNDYAVGHERQTTMDFHHQLKGAIMDAVDDGLIVKDPTRKAIIKGKPPVPKKVKYLNQFELHLLLSDLDLQGKLNWDWMILLIAKTGIRFSEALAITPADFDFSHQMLSINKTWDYKGNGGFLPTKNKSSVRKIQIDWQTVIQFAALVKDVPEDKPIFVFKEHAYNSTVNDALERHCNRAKIPVISVHGLRHTHASVLLFAGVSIASVARRLGHSSMTTTQKTYLHIIQELENQDIDLVMRSLSGLS